MSDIWPLPPLVPGDWKTLSLADATAVLARYSAIEIAAGHTPSAEIVEYSRVRALRLTAAPKWLLIEAEAKFADGAEGVLTALYGPEHRLTGATWAPSDLVDLALASEWVDDSAARVLDYLRLFVNYMQGDDGRFMTVESPDDVRALCNEGADLAAAVATVTPLGVTEKEGAFYANGFVIYAGALYQVTFLVSRDGMVTMTGDTALAELPARAEELRGAFRVRFHSA